MKTAETYLADWPLICPTCRTPLQRREVGYGCATCATVYPADGRLIHFVAANEFYEGKYTVSPVTHVPNTTSLPGKFWLYQYSQHYLWYITRYVPRGARMLDVAGGAGMLYLAANWQTAGLEISAPHAREMAFYTRAEKDAAIIRPPRARNGQALPACAARRWLANSTGNRQPGCRGVSLLPGACAIRR